MESFKQKGSSVAPFSHIGHKNVPKKVQHRFCIPVKKNQLYHPVTGKNTIVYVFLKYLVQIFWVIMSHHMNWINSKNSTFLLTMMF